MKDSLVRTTVWKAQQKQKNRNSPCAAARALCKGALSMSSEAELEELLNGSPGLGSDLGLSPTRSASPSAGAESPCRSSISRRSSTSRLSYSASRAAHKRAARSRSRSRSHSSRGGSSQAPSPRYDDDESDGRRADVESPAPRRTEDDSDDDHADGSDQMGGNVDACDDGPPNVDDRDPDPVPVPRRTTVQSNFSWGPLTGVNVSTLPPADKAKRQAQKGGLKIPPGSKPVQSGKQASVSLKLKSLLGSIQILCCVCAPDRRH